MGSVFHATGPVRGLQADSEGKAHFRIDNVSDKRAEFSLRKTALIGWNAGGRSRVVFR